MNEITVSPAFQEGVRKVISNIKLTDNKLYLTFTTGCKICIYDDSYQCCETRYMTTDDNLDNYINSELIDATIKYSMPIDDETGDVHEVQFLEILTSKGSFVIASHNEHNGYYGGFDLTVEAT